MIPVQPDFSANVQAAYCPPRHARHRVIGPLEYDCCDAGDRDVHAVPRVPQVECLPSHMVHEKTGHSGQRHHPHDTNAQLVQHFGSLLLHALGGELWGKAYACSMLTLQ